MKKYFLTILSPHQNIKGKNPATNGQKREAHQPNYPRAGFWLGGVLAAATILGLLAFFSPKNEKVQYSSFGNKLTAINIGGRNFTAEVVNTKEKKQLGLSGREILCSKCAMLFVYKNKNIYPFWMKNMRFDLDMVWISGNEVVNLAKNVPYAKGTAETVNPGVLADKVLEMNAGISDELGIKVGDEVSFSD